MVIIKAKGEYYYRELERLENEPELTEKEKKDISRRKKKYQELDNDMIKCFQSLFTGGNEWVMDC